MALPEDYGVLWGSDDVKTTESTTTVKDPFRDPSTMSGVTGSWTTSIADAKASKGKQPLRESTGNVPHRWSASSHVEKGFEDTNVKILEDLEGLVDKLTSTYINSDGKKSMDMSNFMNQLDDIRGRQTKLNNDRIDYLERRGASAPTIQEFTEFTRGVASTIAPIDSVSNIQRPLNVRKQARQEVDNMSRISEVDETVIGGYIMNAEEKLKEIDSMSNIKPIRGLPIIFTNSRLNFLTHLHDALFQFLTDSHGNYPSQNCLLKLQGSRKRWGQGPSKELLEHVIDITICRETAVVLANPFALPVLEVTMVVTPNIMFMCLDLLHKEFEMQWFNTMKAVTTPKFQSKYESLRFGKSERSGSSSSGHRHNRVTSSSSSVGSSRRRGSNSSGRSVISAFFGAQ